MTDRNDKIDEVLNFIFLNAQKISSVTTNIHTRKLIIKGESNEMRKHCEIIMMRIDELDKLEGYEK